MVFFNWDYSGAQRTREPQEHKHCGRCAFFHVLRDLLLIIYSGAQKGTKSDSYRENKEHYVVAVALSSCSS